MNTGNGIHGSIENSYLRASRRFPTSPSAPLAVIVAIGGLMLVLPSVLLWGADAAGATHPNATSGPCAPLLGGELAASSTQSGAPIVATALGEQRFVNCRADIYARSDDDEDNDNNDNDDADDSDDPGAADWQVTPTEVVEA